jgi:hypothetical protein
MAAAAGTLYVSGFVQFTTTRAHDYMFGMSRIIGNQISGEKVNLVSALFATDGLHPQEVFHRYVPVAVMAAICLIISADIRS